jgi:type II secretory pathway component PulJ
MSRARSAAFTLIEVLAVLFLTAIVIGVALNFFVELSNQSARATETTRDVRRATSLLDRVAHDFERTVLVSKPAETDPLAHPWIFLAESRLSDGGADRVKFVTRRSPEGRFDAPRSDIAVITYALAPREDDGGFDLVRSTAPLPTQLDREFPPSGDESLVPLAENIESFHLRFLGENGDWVTEWDSSQLLDSSELPIAVEIEVALAEDLPSDDELDVQEPQSYKRRVLLPLRPFDLAALFDPTAGAEGEFVDEDGDGIDDNDPSGGRTVAQCINEDVLAQRKPKGSGALGGLGNLSQEELATLRRFVENADSTPFAEFADLYCGHPVVRPECC